MNRLAAGVLLAGLLSSIAACEGKIGVPPLPTSASCDLSISPSSQAAPRSGGSFRTTLTGTCAWTATTNDSWITIGTPQGSGAGSVTYTVQPNPGDDVRQGRVRISELELLLTQAGSEASPIPSAPGPTPAPLPSPTPAPTPSPVPGPNPIPVPPSPTPDPGPCPASVDPGSMRVQASGATVNFAVSASADCIWSASTNVSWIAIQTRSGAGSATGAFVVNANGGSSRSGNVSIGRQTISVSQDAAPAPAPAPCPASVEPASVHVKAGGETVSFSVSAPADCQWAVSTDASWIAVRTSSGVGSNGGSFDVKANDGSARSGSVKVGELSIPVTQDAAAPKPQPQPCPVSVGPGSVQVKAAGETTVIFSVSASQECQWSASTKTSWITIEKGSGSGGANGSFVVKQNDGPMRSGQVDVGRFAISVSQDAAAPKPEPQPCPASVTPPRVDVKAAGDTTVTFSVSASQECQWSASTKTSWIIIEKGSGGGAGSFVVKQNDGPMRSGQVDVGRFAISVSQDAAAAKPDPPTPDKRCPLSLSPGSITVPIEGGRFVFKVIVDTGCPWSVASLPPWISLTSKAGTGTAEVIVTVAGNSGPTRTDIVVVNGVSITVSQKGTGLTR